MSPSVRFEMTSSLCPQGAVNIFLSTGGDAGTGNMPISDMRQQAIQINCNVAAAPKLTIANAIESRFKWAAMRKKRLKFTPNDPRVVALKRAIKIAGGQAALARMVGISPQGLWWWEVCPAERCLQVSQFTGVSVHELRPDVFGFVKQRLMPDEDLAEAG
jgi:DNA-binding transcriptional regulator YdaS (Cro superfamily)